MLKYNPYAYLKTIDGEEVREYTKENFESTMAGLDYRIIEKSDRKLYFINTNASVNGIKFFKDDYFEVVNR